MYKLNQKVNLNKSKFHQGFNLEIKEGVIVKIKNRLNPFKKTEYVILLADGLIDGDKTFPPYVGNFTKDEITQ